MRIDALSAAALLAHMDTAGVVWWWPNFTPAELASRDTGRISIQTDSLDRLQRLRTAFARPIILTSGYRTPEENARKSSTGLTGPHTTGRAFDLKCLDSRTRGQLVRMAVLFGFTGIGIAPTFLHLDDVPPGVPHIPRFADAPVIWLY